MEGLEWKVRKCCEPSNVNLFRANIITYTLGTICKIFFVIWKVPEHSLTTAYCRNLES